MDRLLRMLISAIFASGVLLVAYGVAHDVVLAWCLGCVGLGFAVNTIIDHGKRDQS